MTGIARIAAERKRQTEKEGWTPDHDAKHVNEEMVDAAVCYALNKRTRPRSGGILSVIHPFNEKMRKCRVAFPFWPWHERSDKREKHDRVRSLAIAGALFAAEIDRLQAAEKEQEKLELARVLRESGMG